MARPAKDIVKLVKKNADRRSDEAYKVLKEKSLSLLTEMIKAGEYSTEIELSDEDRVGLPKLAQEMRDLGYNYCLIEVQNEAEEVLAYRLRVSLSHLKGK